jgi:type I restriction enzyme M protein
MDEDQTQHLISTYLHFAESDISKIFDNTYFGYTKVTIEQPLKEDGRTVTNKQGEPKPDPSLRDHERVPLSEDIETYFHREVQPHLPAAWIDWDKNKVGYEINFTKYFYTYKPLRSLQEITSDLMRLEEESETLMSQIVA